MHFAHRYRICDLWWPKGFNRKQRQLFNIPAVNDRVASDLEKCLYVKSSEYVNATQGTDIGRGLFASVAWDTDTHICISWEK